MPAHSNNIFYYLIAAALFVLLKFGYTFAGSDTLIFLLKPANLLVGLLTGSHSVYIPCNGYYYDKLDILIEKSCSGFNFWLICFLVFTWLFIKYSNKPAHKMVSIPTALAGAYLLTIFVNASRILASIFVQNQANIFLPDRIHYLFHEAVGITVNLSFLVMAYYMVEKFLKHRQHAKLS